MDTLFVKACGIVSCVGFNAASSLAALRAGIRNIKESYLWNPIMGENINVGKVSLPHWWIDFEKLPDLVAPAIYECLAAAHPIPANEIPVLIGVASPDRPFRWEHLDERILEEIEYRLNVKFHHASQVIARGRVSGIAGIEKTGVLFERYGLKYCIIAGVDSLLQQNLAEFYLNSRRILTSQNSNGFSLGEAGAACLIGRTGKPNQDELHFLSTSITREKATIESEKPLRADGLTQAYREVLTRADLEIYDVDYRITDLNGEHYKFKEAALADLRFQRKPKEKLYDLWHPNEFLGDIGAAIGPCVFGVAMHASQKGYAIGPTALIHFGNDNGERAAAIVRHNPR